MFSLIATDLDGTVLRSDASMSERTAAALRAVQDAGAMLVPVTARPPAVTFPVAQEFDIRGVAICGNGALVVDLASHEVLERRPLAPEAARAVILAIREAVPGALFACEDGLQYRCEPGYPTIVPEDQRVICDALDFFDVQISKLVCKQPRMDQAELREIVRAAVGEHASIFNSGPDWIEIHAHGVTKGAMLADLAASRGIPRERVIAFGDYTTDVPMLQWAGRGVAPASSFPEALRAADEVCAACEEDGVAIVLEQLLSEGRIGSA